MSRPALWSQFRAVVGVAARGMRRRVWSALNASMGTATVIGVLVVLLSIATGYEQALNMAGADNNAIVMQSGARSELESNFSGEHARLAVNAEGIAHDDAGAPLAAVEAYAIASLESAVDGEPMNVALRGVEPGSYRLREALRVVEGRRPEPGARELIVGRRMQEHHGGLALGQLVPIADGSWQVVGVFEADGGVVESELWTELSTLQSAYQRGDSAQVVFARADGDDGVARLRDALASDPRLALRVVSEADYYSQQAGQMGRFVKTIGYSVVFLMGLAAVFAALNASHAAASARSREIATFLALGMDDRAIMGSVLLESVALALLGAVIGCAGAIALFNGHVSSTLFYSQNFSQVVFAFTVTPMVLAQAVAGAVVVGVAGGIGPALRATRLPVSQVLAMRR